GAGARSGGDRGPGGRAARPLGALRGAVPRERGPRAVAAAAHARRADAALRAAPARADPARGGTAVPLLPRRARDLSRLSPGRVRRAGPDRAAAGGARPRGAGRGGRDAGRVSLRALAGVRLDRRLPLP